MLQDSLIPWSYTTSAGFTLRGEHSRPSGKPVIHFLHGTGFRGRTYWPMLALLQEHFDLFLSDVQGHGESDHGGDFLGWNRTAELAMLAWGAHKHLFAGVEHFGVGHSFGGVLTGMLQGGEHPPFAKAVLLDPVLFSPAMMRGMAVAGAVGLYKRNMFAKAAARRRASWANAHEALHYLEGRGMYKGWSTHALQSFIDWGVKPSPQGGVALTCLPRREADLFASFPKRMWSSLRKVQHPVMVMHGVDSYRFIAPSVKRWMHSNHTVTSQQVPGGHCFMQQFPEDAAQRVTAYLLGTTSNLPNM